MIGRAKDKDARKGRDKRAIAAEPPLRPEMARTPWRDQLLATIAGNRLSLVLMASTWALAFATLAGGWGATADLARLRGEIDAVRASTPVVPVVAARPAPPERVAALVETLAAIWPELTAKAEGSAVLLSSGTPEHYAKFMAALGYVLSAESTWRWTPQTLCVGSKCQGGIMSAKLAAEAVKVQAPQARAGG